ncbi:MAG: kinase/pyrophosphorylase [Gammaproteobacteria bacterium]|nr:kinase/pyrophosphorylase [Gammaproteobacteria bacterium]
MNGNTPVSSKRSVFFVSDGTGITAETLGRSLLTQFEGILFQKTRLPFVDNPEKARMAVERINLAAQGDSMRPLVFSTLINREVRDIVARSNGLVIEFFDTFTGTLEAELGVGASRVTGRSHGIGSYDAYTARIGALNFALNNDDGATTRNYAMADVIITGVSRCGKTPTSLYLALQYGIHAANYPITEEDLGTSRLPTALQPYRDKLFGLTIDPERLQQIRSERRPDSRYATLTQCRMEVAAVEEIYAREHVRFLNTTTMSVEEIAASIILQAGLKRRL